MKRLPLALVAGPLSAMEEAVTDGVAPDAHLARFAIGAVLFTTAVVRAYDYMLDQPHVSRRGVRVVFAAGNSGSENAQMSLNPFSDNSRPVGITAGGHTTFTGHLGGLPARRGSRSRAEAGTAGADARPGSARPPGDGDEGDARPSSPAGPAVPAGRLRLREPRTAGGLLDDTQRVTLGGSDSRTYRVQVGRGVDALRVALQLRSGAGRYTLSVSGDYAASDPDTLDSDSVLGRMVTLHVAQVSQG